MIFRALLLLFLVMMIYSALKTIFRSASRAYHEGERTAQVRGEEMVLDPQCRTYVIRGRAITRRIEGKPVFFCSEECAARHEASLRA